MPILVLRALGNNIALNQVKGPKIRDVHKTFMHQKTFKLMKVIGSNNIIIGGFSIQPIHSMTYMQTYNATICNPRIKIKRNLKLYALTNMQTKNHNRKYELPPPPCLDQAYYSTKKKVN